MMFNSVSSLHFPHLPFYSPFSRLRLQSLWLSNTCSWETKAKPRLSSYFVARFWKTWVLLLCLCY